MCHVGLGRAVHQRPSATAVGVGRLAALQAALLALTLGLPAVLCPIGPATAAEPTPFDHRVFRDDEGEHKYALFVPRAYTPERQWPIIVYLHGAGERGTDGVRQTEIGLGPFVKQRAESFPFLVLFPQAEDMSRRLLTGWLHDSPDSRRMLKILESVESLYSVDPQRRILTGWSMGGYGTWSIGAAYPDRWAALVPIAGGGQPAWADKLRDIPIRSFHGAQDAAVRPEESRQMIDALKAAGAQPQYTEVPKGGHDVWKTVYDSDELYTWMRNPTGVGATSPLLARPGRPTVTAAESDEPFIPALEIENALRVHLGNDALKAIADAVPYVVSDDLLSGRIGDIYQTTSAEGYTFGVTFTRIGYRGQLARAHASAYRPGRLNIQLGLRNVMMNIGTTYVQGSGRSAVAGPINIVIGHRRPVWLSVDVLPYVQNRRLKMKLLATRFEIPSDNWYVSAPAGVSTRGLGMTRERVSSGLVSGIYRNRARIENEVRAIVPSMLPQLEERLALDRVADLVQSIWPLPVYRPRVRVWPQDVVTDQQGLTIVMGVTAAAVDPRQAPREPSRVSLADRQTVAKLSRGDELSVDLAAGILEPLTELLIRADVSRINVRDIPEKSFARLSERPALARVIPDLKRFPETASIWSELILQQPMQVRDAGGLPGPTASVNGAVTTGIEPRRQDGGTGDGRTASHAPGAAETNAVNQPGSAPRQAGLQDQPAESDERQAGSQDQTAETDERQSGSSEPAAVEIDDASRKTRLCFDLPRVVVSLAVQNDRSGSEWQPLAEFDFHLSQLVTAEVMRSEFTRCGLRLDWVGNPQLQVAGRLAPGYEALDSRLNVDAMQQLFLDAWNAWTQSEPVSDVVIDDLDFGYTRLRLDALEWGDPFLQARFGNPGVRITNGSEIPLVYETKGPFSSWGGPYTLEPGRSHEYDVAFPLLYRRRTDSGYRMFTLPAGSHSEFRAAQEGSPPQLYSAAKQP